MIQRGFRWGIALWALTASWMSRYAMNPDGMSYLDMGDRYWHGDWHAALNAYWSPLYAWLTGLLFRIAPPTMRWEFPEVHLLNFAVLIATLFCFEFFWRQLLASSDIPLPSRQYAWCIGYLLFIYMHFVGIASLLLVTPDLLVTALLYLTAGWMLRFAAGRMHPATALLFGCLLGIGYLAKAAMLPFGLLMLAAMFAIAWKRGGKWLAGTALLGFLLISVPFIAALSWNCRRLTFGDSGKINVAWFVNGSPEQWHIESSGSVRATLRHPPRKLLDWPEVYEFAAPVAGTYPLWYDPSYWNAGIDTSLHPLRTLVASRRNLVDLAEYVCLRTGFITAALLFLFLLGDRRRSWRRLLAFWPVALPAFAMFLMYAMVAVHPRYFAGETVVLWGVVMASAGGVGEEHEMKIWQTAMLTLAVMVFCLLPPSLVKDHLKDTQYANDVVLAERLRSMGIQPGSHVAILGEGVEAFWARLDGVKIVAQVPEDSAAGNSAAAFWNLPQEGRQRVLGKLKTTGALAVIAQAPPKTLPPGWVPVKNTTDAVHFFH